MEKIKDFWYCQTCKAELTVLPKERGTGYKYCPHCYKELDLIKPYNPGARYDKLDM